MWLHLPSSLPGFTLAKTCSEKNKPQTFPFTGTNNSIVLSVRRPVKYFFAPISPIFRKSREEKEDGENRQMKGVLLFKQTQK